MLSYITGCFFNFVIYDLALIHSFFWIFEIGRTFFHSIHRRIFKNDKTFFNKTNFSMKKLSSKLTLVFSLFSIWCYNLADYYKNVLSKNYDSHQICLFIIYFTIISYSITTNLLRFMENKMSFSLQNYKMYALAYVFNWYESIHKSTYKT